MSRPKKIDDETILTTTRGLLLDRGLRVTTRAIAAEAGISEGVLFQRFRSKEELIRAALSLPEIDAVQLVAGSSSGENSRVVLENIAVAYFSTFRRLLPLYVPLISQPVSGMELERALQSRTSPFMMFVDALERHLTAERHAGRIRTESPYRTSYFIVSALHNAALLEAIAGPSADISEGTARDLIGIVWQGLEPRDAK